MTKRNIIFFDAETNREKSIVDLGALSWADGAIFHAARVAGLQRFVRDHGGESAPVSYTHLVMRFCPGALLAMKASSSAASTASPAGSPSIVTPMAAAWLWPKTAVRMFLPK